MKTLREDSYHRSFVAMRNALRSIIFHEGDCYRHDEPESGEPCECPICIAKIALENEEDWRFQGYSPDRLRSMPRELAMVDAWKRYFKRVDGRPTDGRFAEILGVPLDSVSERDWYVATTVVQWLATGVGQSVLSDAGYEYRPKDETPKPQT